MKKFEFKFRCDENPLKMEKTTIQNGEKILDTRHCENASDILLILPNSHLNK